jgi:hypothetical protein
VPLYSIDDHGVVTFCRPADDEERGVFATLKARAVDPSDAVRPVRRPRRPDSRPTLLRKRG